MIASDFRINWHLIGCETLNYAVNLPGVQMCLWMNYTQTPVNDQEK